MVRIRKSSIEFKGAGSGSEQSWFTCQLGTSWLSKTRSKWGRSCFLSLPVSKSDAVSVSVSDTESISSGGISGSVLETVLSVSLSVLTIEERKPSWLLQSKRRQADINQRVIGINKTWCGSSYCHTLGLCLQVMKCPQKDSALVTWGGRQDAYVLMCLGE